MTFEEIYDEHCMLAWEYMGLNPLHECRNMADLRNLPNGYYLVFMRGSYLEEVASTAKAMGRDNDISKMYLGYDYKPTTQLTMLQKGLLGTLRSNKIAQKYHNHTIQLYTDAYFYRLKIPMKPGIQIEAYCLADGDGNRVMVDNGE